MTQTLRLTLGSEDGLYFEEAVWEDGKALTTLRFGDIETADMLLGLLSLRIQGFVEGASAFHAEGVEEATGTCEDEEPPP